MVRSMARSVFQQEMEAKLTAVIEPIVAAQSYDLVELSLVRRKANSLLRVLADRAGGITLDGCAKLSRKISYALEVEDIIEGKYTLEVSSPGLDRPLTTVADFRRRVGETIRLTFKDEGRSVTEGTLLKVDNEILTLETVEGELPFRYQEVLRGSVVY